MVQPAEEPDEALARRLRELRKHHWPGHPLTQSQLADVLGGLSVGLISSWEKDSQPVQPPVRHLETYAQFFATERSIERRPFRLLSPTELTPAEREHRDQLLDDLIALRAAARAGHTAPAGAEPAGRTLWHYTVNQDITIVCAPLPAEKLGSGPYTEPANPDYVRATGFADLDALIELYGHLRATNPGNKVKYRTSAELRPDDYTGHLVLLGGVDWNEAVRDVERRIDIPVTQTTRTVDSNYGAFDVDDDSGKHSFQPTVIDNTLVQDIAHFYRGPNPFNRKRTVTFLNGMFGRGTLGIVRALTDARFRDRNEEYLRARFAGSDTFSVLTRVPVVNGRAVTPDWTIPQNRLHEWSKPIGSGAPEPDDKAG